MSKSTSSGSTSARAQSPQATAGQAALSDLTRQQLAAAAETASAVFRVSEVVQQVQQQMAQRAALAHQQAAEQLRSVNDPSEVLAIQSNLLMSGFREMTQFWQELTMAGMRLQAEMMGRTVQQPEPTAQVGIHPMMQAWQSMFTAGQQLNGAAPRGR